MDFLGIVLTLLRGVVHQTLLTKGDLLNASGAEFEMCCAHLRAQGVPGV